MQPSMNADRLKEKYFVEVDRITRVDWEGHLSRFNDASLYQSWSYGVARWGDGKLSHLVLKEKEEVVGIAQVTVVRLPVVGAGIASVSWGPLWRRRDRTQDLGAFKALIVSLKEEYAGRRGLLVRIAPNVFCDEGEETAKILREEGYERNGPQYRTLVLDLTRTIDAIRKSLDQKWRNQLNRAEKNSLSVLEGTGEDLYDMFSVIYRDMMSRKKFNTSVDIEVFREVQRDLPGRQKMQILVCEYQKRPVAAVIGTRIGESGIFLLGATSNDGANHKGSYLLQWKLIQWLKDKGAQYYDLGGIDPVTNPGVYHFKSGISGKERKHIGQFEWYENRLSASVVRVFEATGPLRRAINKGSLLKKI